MSRSRSRPRYSSSSASYTSSSSDTSLPSDDRRTARGASRTSGKMQKSSTKVISPEQRRQLDILRKEAKDILLDMSCDLANRYTRKPKVWLEKRLKRELPPVCDRHSRRVAEQAKQDRHSSSSSGSGSLYGSGGSSSYISSDSDGRGPRRSPCPPRGPGPHRGQRLLLDRPYRDERQPSPYGKTRPAWQRVSSFDEAVEDAKRGHRRGEIDSLPPNAARLHNVHETPATGSSANKPDDAPNSAPRLPDLMQVYSRRTRRAKRVSSKSSASSSSASITSTASLSKPQASIVPSAAPIASEAQHVPVPIHARIRTPSPQAPPTHIVPPSAPITKPDEAPKTRPPRPESTLSKSSAAQTEDWVSTYKAYQRSHLSHSAAKTPSPPASVAASDISSMPPTPKSDTYRFPSPIPTASGSEGSKKVRPRIQRQGTAGEGRPLISANEPWSRKQSDDESPYTNLPEVVPGFQVSFPASSAAPVVSAPTASDSRPTSSSSQNPFKTPYQGLSGQEDIPEPLRVGPRPTATAPFTASRPGYGGNGSPISPPGSSLSSQARRPAFMFVSGSKRRTYSPGGSEIDRKRDA